MPHTHFTLEKRIKLEGFLETNLTIGKIAELLQVHPASIYAELKRNIPDKTIPSINRYHYCAMVAQAEADKRRQVANQHSRKLGAKEDFVTRSIIAAVKRRWSPEQISHRFRKYGIIHNHVRVFVSLSTQTIYNWIYRFHPALKRFLRRGKRYHVPHQNQALRALERERQSTRSIDRRPHIVSYRGRIGDFEGDTILGKGHGATGRIGTLVDRRTGFLVAFLLPPLSPAEAKLSHEEQLSRGLTLSQRFNTAATNALMRRIKPEFIRSLTLDNGPENRHAEDIEKLIPGIQVYFARPYASYERGTNENTNGLLRQYFPKGSDFTKITEEKLDKVVRQLNNRPRKRLCWMTPLKKMDHNHALKPCYKLAIGSGM